MVRFCLSLVLSFFVVTAAATDTLFLKLANPWNTVKAADGKYLRKAVPAEKGWLAYDYNAQNILVAKGYFADTGFLLKWNKHEYFNEEKGYLEELRNYDADGYLHGIRAGFNASGDTLWRESYQQMMLVDSVHFAGYTEGSKERHPVEFTEAMFPGGAKGWNDYIQKNIQYPAQAAKKKLHGQVVISFLVLPNGKTEFHKIEQSVHPLLDNEVKRIIINSPLWQPAVLEGRKVAAYRVQPITF